MKLLITSLLLCGQLLAIEVIAEPLQIIGALSGEPFDIIMEGSMGSRVEISDVTAEDLDQAAVDLQQFMPGEQVRIIATSQIRAATAELMTVPHPIASTANGYSLTLIPMEQSREQFMVRASGFEGEKEVRIVTRCGEEESEFPVPLSRGSIAFGFAPTGEDFTIELQGIRGSVSISDEVGMTALANRR